MLSICVLKMNYYLYILKSIKNGRYYYGSTSNIEKRIRKHNNGNVRSTKAYRPWILIYKEEFVQRGDARKREINLKNNFQARKELFEKIIE